MAEARAAEAAKKKDLEAEQKTPTGMGFRTLANEYLDFCQRRFSEKNYKEKVFIFKSFAAHLGPLREIATITARDIIGYLSTRPGNANWNKHRKSICALFQWAFKHGLFSINPCLYVDSMPETPAKKKIPCQEEMVRILLSSGENRSFFLALYSLAARLGEINNLRWEDVNFENWTVTLWTRKSRGGNPRPQVKAMNQDLYEELRRLHDKHSTAWVFPNPRTENSYKNRRAQIKRACLDGKVPYYTWHSIRHFVASLLADEHKISLPTIQRMLGHQRLTTTERYVQTLSEGQREVADLLKIDQKFTSKAKSRE